MVAGGFLVVSLTLGRTVNVNFVLWFTHGCVVATRKEHPSYFWGNIAVRAVVFLGAGYWVIRLSISR